MIVSFLVPLYKCVHMVVAEKDSKMRESLRMVGMSESSFWLSWLAYFTWVNTLVSLSMVTGLYMLVFDRSDYTVTFAFVWTYGQSLFGFVIIAQSLFQSPKLAGVVTSVVYLGISLMERLFTNSSLSTL